MFAAVLGGRSRPFLPDVLPDGADSWAALMSSASDAARAGCEMIRAAAKTAQMGSAIQTAPTRVRIEEGADTGIEEAPTDIRAEDWDGTYFTWNNADFTSLRQGIMFRCRLYDAGTATFLGLPDTAFRPNSSVGWYPQVGRGITRGRSNSPGIWGSAS